MFDPYTDIHKQGHGVDYNSPPPPSKLKFKLQHCNVSAKQFIQSNQTQNSDPPEEI